jgi:endogenous inhibitor of DNA gyrase (YacG/DUF329 family)
MYKKFNETRAETIFVDEWIEMVWASSVKDYYESLGYEYTGYLDKFWVHIDDLVASSGVYVNVQCPVCMEIRSSRRSQTKYSGHTLCRGCTKILDLTNIRFGRWVALHIHEIVNGQVYWMCRCDCGTEKPVQGASLMKKNTTSCGCYRHEFLSSRTGKKSPVWVGPITLCCEQCGTEYEARDSWDAKRRRFCSKECQGVWASENRVGENSANWKGGDVELKCEWCGESFLVHQGRANEARFCSNACVGKWRSENIIGELHPNWDSSLSDSERYVNRSSIEYHQYIKDVMKKDEYTCQICGGTEDIEVHHQYSYAHYPEYAHDVRYGLVMCEFDHKSFHSWNGGYNKRCEPADLDRWLYETA